MSSATDVLQDSALLSKYDLALGCEHPGNPFFPARQIQAHAVSVLGLCLKIQPKRNSPQRIAEVGVWQGQMSRWLLTCLPKAEVHLIDPWQAADPGSTWYQHGDRFAKRPQEQHDIHYALVAKMCEDFAPRAKQYRGFSTDSAGLFPDGFFDVVFIDAAHDYQNVKRDIHAWHKKVRSGGYLSGHDYRVGGNYFGLVRGVEEATSELGLTIEPMIGKVWACRM